MRDMNKTVIIAEIGENYIGNLNTAKSLIKKAAEAGVDYVKFQSYKPDNFRKSDPEMNGFVRSILAIERILHLKNTPRKQELNF